MLNWIRRIVRRPNSNQILAKYEAGLALQRLVDSLQDQLKREREISDSFRVKAEKYEALYIDSLKTLDSARSFEAVSGRTSMRAMQQKLEEKYRQEAELSKEKENVVES